MPTSGVNKVLGWVFQEQIPSLGPKKLQDVFFFLNKIIYFMYLFLTALGLRCCARAFSSCSERGLLSVAVCSFSLWWLLLLQSTGSRHMGFSSCGSWALERRLSSCSLRAQQLCRTGLVAPLHVGSSRTRDRTRVPCIGRWILNHCATTEAPFGIFSDALLSRETPRSSSSHITCGSFSLLKN